MMAVIKILISSVCALFILCSCEHRLDDALELAGDNKGELEIVLEHFKEDSNPLKYKAAVFLIENMPYHESYYGENAKMCDDIYISMARNAKELRDSVISSKSELLLKNNRERIPDIKTVKSEYLIKVINEACDTWDKVNWNKDYDESLFLNYVLPYRVFDEMVSNWHDSIKRCFPYLTAPVVYSQSGVRFPAYQEKLTKAKIVESTSALNGKSVQIDRKGASVTYFIYSGLDVQKLVRLRYSTLAKDAKALIEINDKLVSTHDLEPTNNIFSFRGSRFGIVVDLKKGVNKITVKHDNRPFNLDYIELAAYEQYSNDSCEDYSTSYCQIQNAGSCNYVSFDTLQSTNGEPIKLRSYSAKDRTLNMRFEYLGYPMWKIMPMDNVDLCLEDRWVSLDTLQAVSKYKTIGSNKGDAHQKWVIIPVEGGMFKIMNKLTGLFWESTVDKETGKEILIQNFYSGKMSQKWRIIKKTSNTYAKSFFKIGSMLSYGLRVTDVMKQFESITSRGDITPSLSSVCMYRTGTCQDETSYTVALSRYLGMPTAVDFVPHWGNRPNHHSWAVIIMPNGKSVPFYMGFAPGDTAQYAHSYLKPKIFRRCFNVNNEIAEDLSEEKSVPEMFKAPNFIDVTDEYYDTKNVTRYIPKKYANHKIAYICVSDRENWIPVHYGKISRNTVTFKSMGPNILYTVGVWENNQIVPFGHPFVLKTDGSIKEIVCNKKKKQSMTLYRKYPFFAKFDEFNGRMGLGRFQGSNKGDFSDESTLYTHEGATEGCWLEANLTPSSQTYRYLRYIGHQGSYCNVNEIEFYNSRNQKLTGKIIGTQGTDKQTKESVFDGDVLTGFNGVSPDGHWVGLHLSRPSDVSKIRYMPRNDGNCVEVGDMYHLLMYDKGRWVYLALMRAETTKLVINNVPSEGLYILKDISKGKEERVFTYENGKQVWW